MTTSLHAAMARQREAKSDAKIDTKKPNKTWLMNRRKHLNIMTNSLQYPPVPHLSVRYHNENLSPICNQNS